jgi:hypothetical protein
MMGLNAAIGDMDRTFVLDDMSRLEPIRAALQARLEGDLAAHCDEDSTADANAFLLVATGQIGSPDLAFVTRVTSYSADGSYSRGCSLIYSLEAGTGAVGHVRSDSY